MKWWTRNHQGPRSQFFSLAFGRESGTVPGDEPEKKARQVLQIISFVKILSVVSGI